jgi:hypothetical protein
MALATPSVHGLVYALACQTQAASRIINPMNRRFQFSLRVLLVILTCLCIWLGARANSVRRQREAIARIDGLGAFAYYAFEWNESRDWFQTGAVGEPGPTWLRNLLGIDWLNPVVAIRFEGCSITDADLDWLIERLPELRYLELRHASIGDRGLANLGQLQRLRNLEVAGTHIGDGAMVAIGRVRSLRSLDLCDTNVTNNGLKSLSALTELRSIYLESTAVTHDGVANLKKALPKLQRRRY